MGALSRRFCDTDGADLPVPIWERLHAGGLSGGQASMSRWRPRLMTSRVVDAGRATVA